MGKVNAKGMSDFEAQRQRRKESLRQLTSKPFELINGKLDPNQEKALKKYIDEFELFTNQMYMYQAVSKGMTAWMGSWVIARFLPIPEFVNSVLAVVLYLGIASRILERFSMTDFNEHLKEMKTLYNWCLKNNNPAYNPDIDNSEKLASPIIQRLIKLLAPLCDSDFTIVWKREVEQNEESRGSWSKTVKAGFSAVSSTFSIFSRSAAQTTVEQNRIKELKVNVETGNLDVGTFQGFKQSIEYFASSAEFRALLATKLQSPRAVIQQIVPSMIMESFAPKLA